MLFQDMKWEVEDEHTAKLKDKSGFAVGTLFFLTGFNEWEFCSNDMNDMSSFEADNIQEAMSKCIEEIREYCECKIFKFTNLKDNLPK